MLVAQRFLLTALLWTGRWLLFEVIRHIRFSLFNSLFRSLKLTFSTQQMHRTLLAQAPLESITPGDLADVKQPNIVFIAIPRHSIITVGPFEEVLDPLLMELEVDVSMVESDRIILPCFQRQLPSVHKGSEVRFHKYRRKLFKARPSLLFARFHFHPPMRFVMTLNLLWHAKSVPLCGPSLPGRHLLDLKSQGY